MTPEIALQFMQRVQLTGEEVPAFNAVASDLHSMAASKPRQDIAEGKRIESSLPPSNAPSRP